MPTFARDAAEERPHEIALRDAHVELTWEQVGAWVDRVASRLLASDLGAHRRIAVFAENSADCVLAHVAGLVASTSVVPVNFHLTAPEAAYLLADSGARLVLCGPETAARAVAAAREAGVEQVVGWHTDDAGVTTLDDWCDRGPTAPLTLEDPPRPNLLYTSGTTGQPKGTELPPTMFAGGATLREHLERLRAHPFAAHGTHLVVGPLYHTGPLQAVRLLGAGIPVVVLGRFDAAATLAAIERFRIETSVLVPTHFARLLALPEHVRDSYDVSSLRFVVHTGAACPIDVKAAMLDWWGPVLYEAYGATEVGTTCLIGPDEWRAHPGSVGRPNPPLTATVLDDAGTELPPGTEGNLYFRDPTGRGIVYHDGHEACAPGAHRAAVDETGLFTLGEVGYVDDDGYVYITDRASDMVVSGGVNVYPAEAEQRLVTHPEVADAAGFGVPDDVMGEAFMMLVVPRDHASPPDPEALRSWLRDRLTHYKCPARIVVVESLDRTAMGKLVKRRLRDRFLAGELT
ncbi:MAG: AMP-binding protein [Actinobacteria bacterium]|nr:AMP-binding protein [Actinomycetota bacterium]